MAALSLSRVVLSMGSELGVGAVGYRRPGFFCCPFKFVRRNGWQRWQYRINGMTNVTLVSAVGYRRFFFGRSNSLEEEMDDSVGSINGGVIDGIQTSRWCRRIQTAFFFYAVQIGSNKWMAALAMSRVLISMGSERRVGAVGYRRYFFFYWFKFV